MWKYTGRYVGIKIKEVSISPKNKHTLFSSFKIIDFLSGFSRSCLYRILAIVWFHFFFLKLFAFWIFCIILFVRDEEKTHTHTQSNILLWQQAISTTLSPSVGDGVLAHMCYVQSQLTNNNYIIPLSKAMFLLLIFLKNNTNNKKCGK